ncbi:MAG: FliH/SctL family protein, partial [Kangiellaceae bacterium]
KEALSINSISQDQATESTSTKNPIKTNNAAEKSWVLLEDPSMQPGGCIIKTSNSKIDASINQQIAILFSQMIDEQRTAEIREPDSAANTNEE